MLIPHDEQGVQNPAGNKYRHECGVTLVLKHSQLPSPTPP